MNKNQNVILNRTDIINDYLSDISKFELLSKEEEVELFKRIKKGDTKARDKIIEANQRYVFSAAKKYNTGDKLMDLVQEGNLGLIMAIEKYDPDMGTRFLSYARYFIDREINLYLINKNLLIKKSNNNKTIYKINKEKNLFFTKNGRYPTNKELMSIFDKKYGIKIKKEIDMYDLNVSSLNSYVADNDKTTIADTAFFNKKHPVLNEFEDNVNKEYNVKLTEELLKYLNDKERKIVKLVCGIGYDRSYTFSEISDIFEGKYCSERIRQIYNLAIKKMKNVFNYVDSENL